MEQYSDMSQEVKFDVLEGFMRCTTSEEIARYKEWLISAGYSVEEVNRLADNAIAISAL